MTIGGLKAKESYHHILLVKKKPIDGRKKEKSPPNGMLGNLIRIYNELL
jgi:hypothetical protein